FVQKLSPTLLVDRFNVTKNDVDAWEPNYNTAPTDPVLVVRERDDERHLSLVRWGLVPPWAKDPKVGARQFNARAEGIAAKPAFRKAFAKKRCLIPADGFYEWQVIAPPSSPKGRPKKQPVYIHHRDDSPLAFAGLWEVWKVPDGQHVDDADDGWLRTCT